MASEIVLSNVSMLD